MPYCLLVRMYAEGEYFCRAFVYQKGRKPNGLNFTFILEIQNKFQSFFFYFFFNLQKQNLARFCFFSYLQRYALWRVIDLHKDELMPWASHILVTLLLVFHHLGCVIFCTMFSVCKAPWARQNEK